MRRVKVEICLWCHRIIRAHSISETEVNKTIIIREGNDIEVIPCCCDYCVDRIVDDISRDFDLSIIYSS